MKTLKKEEIYAGTYQGLDDLRQRVEEFIEQYYNRRRLHSALAYRSPEEFEEAKAETNCNAAKVAAVMTFLGVNKRCN